MRLLTRPDRPTAIISANNLMALGALQAMNDLGFHCPRDISLATVDTVPWSDVIQPRLTVVVQPIEEIARAAAGFLLDRINSPDQKQILPREKVFIPKLVVGNSCRQPG